MNNIYSLMEFLSSRIKEIDHSVNIFRNDFESMCRACKEEIEKNCSNEPPCDGSLLTPTDNDDVVIVFDYEGEEYYSIGYYSTKWFMKLEDNEYTPWPEKYVIKRWHINSKLKHR